MSYFPDFPWLPNIRTRFSDCFAHLDGARAILNLRKRNAGEAEQHSDLDKVVRRHIVSLLRYTRVFSFS